MLDNLTVNYGGNDERERVKNKENRMVDNDVDIEAAIEKTLRNRAYTTVENRLKINFLNSIKKSHPDYWKFLQKNFKAGGANYEGIYLDNIHYDESTGEYIVRLPNGQAVRFVLERNSAGSYVWVMYYL